MYRVSIELTLIIKMEILSPRSITASTAGASSVSPLSYTNTIFNQSACVLSQDCFLIANINQHYQLNSTIQKQRTNALISVHVVLHKYAETGFPYGLFRDLLSSYSEANLSITYSESLFAGQLYIIYQDLLGFIIRLTLSVKQNKQMNMN